MYDGIKIECALTDPRKFETSLDLIGKHSESTGEVMPYTAECKVKACKFSKLPTRLGTKYFFQGSLHRYARNGGENDDDFYLHEIKKTFHNLKKKYGINPHKSKVLNFEFGVNITLPRGMNAQDFSKYLVSSNAKSFEKLSPKRRQNIGYIAEFNEYSIKVYDKGMQSRTGENNKIRFEIKVDRTRWLDQYGFNKSENLYMSDLLREDNIKVLNDILLNKARSLILTPRKVDTSKLSHKQRLTFYECRDARSWEEWDSKTRARKRVQLAQIFNKLDQSNPVDVLVKLITQKWEELTSFEPVKDIGEKPYKMPPLSTLIVVGFRVLFSFLLNSQEHPKGLNYTIYQPRGNPAPRPPTPNTHTGLERWIDKVTRPPPSLLKPLAADPCQRF